MNSYVVNLYPVSNDQAQMQTVLVGSSATSFAKNLDTNTNVLFFTLHAGSMYVTFDGTTPSSTNGHTIESPYVGWFSRVAVNNMKMVRHAGQTPIVAISQFTH